MTTIISNDSLARELLGQLFSYCSELDVSIVAYGSNKTIAKHEWLAPAAVRPMIDEFVKVDSNQYMEIESSVGCFDDEDEPTGYSILIDHDGYAIRELEYGAID